jgi:hemin uptake protein HemP
MKSDPANPPPSLPSPAVSAPRSASGSLRMSAGELFGDAREIVILHNGREYRLRITQQGKLLLTA